MSYFVIVFEGIDASGKTTLIRRTKEYYESEGIDCQIADEFDSPLQDVIISAAKEDLFLRMEGLPDTTIYQSLMLAADYHYRRARILEHVRQNANEKDTLVLLDRDFISLINYQELFHSMSHVEEVRSFYSIFEDIVMFNVLKPDLLFYFDPNIEESTRRIKSRDKHVLTQDDVALLVRVGDRFEELMKKYHMKPIRLKVSKSPEDNFAIVCESISKLLISGKQNPFIPKVRTQIPGVCSDSYLRICRQYEPTSLTGLDFSSPTVVLNESNNGLLQDVDGNTFLDMSSSFGVGLLGYGNPSLLAAIRKQSRMLYNSLGEMYLNDQRVILSKNLVRLLNKDSLDNVVFGNTGAEAIEIAVKLAYLASHKCGIIAFHGAYHGHTLGTLNLCGIEGLRQPFQHLFPNTVFLATYPNSYREEEDFSFSESTSLEQVENIIKDHIGKMDEIGMLIVEPIQNLNGILCPSRPYFEGIRAICSRYNVLLVADETFTGLLRTGKMLAFDHFQVTPDIVCTGKILGGGLPISACISSKDLFSAFKYDYPFPLHTGTFNGNPLSCAVANAVIESIDDSKTLERISYVSERIRCGLYQLKDKYEVIGDIRGVGMLYGVEMVENSESKIPATRITTEVIRNCLGKGIIFLSGALPYNNVIILSPTYLLTNDQIGYVISALDSAISETLRMEDK